VKAVGPRSITTPKTVDVSRPATSHHSDLQARGEQLQPVHPGYIVRGEFLQPMGINRRALAKAIGVPPQRVLEIGHGRRAVTADTALRLGRYFGVEAQLWLNLQTRYDLDRAEDALGDRLDREVTPRAA